MDKFLHQFTTAILWGTMTGENNSFSINAKKEKLVKFFGENSAYKIYIK